MGSSDDESDEASSTGSDDSVKAQVRKPESTKSKERHDVLRKEIEDAKAEAFAKNVRQEALKIAEEARLEEEKKRQEAIERRNAARLQDRERSMMYSKSSIKTWGRELMNAIDKDSAADIFRLYKRIGYQFLNDQVGENGIGEYVWTPWLEKFLGDTGLHIAAKMRKIGAVCAYVLMGADATIKNDVGMTPKQLVQSKLGLEIEVLKESAHMVRKFPFDFNVHT